MAEQKYLRGEVEETQETLWTWVRSTQLQRVKSHAEVVTQAPGNLLHSTRGQNVAGIQKLNPGVQWVSSAFGGDVAAGGFVFRESTY